MHHVIVNINLDQWKRIDSKLGLYYIERKNFYRWYHESRSKRCTVAVLLLKLQTRPPHVPNYSLKWLSIMLLVSLLLLLIANIVIFIVIVRPLRREFENTKNVREKSSWLNNKEKRKKNMQYSMSLFKFSMWSTV
jgi:hypothetical protein